MRGVPPHDKDFVVVGASVEEMLSLGYKRVGKEFPVFLHPQTRDEYTLARREKKTGDKHTDFVFNFAPDVSLYDDCLRRDFTCNALALDETTGEIIDYFNGRQDIENKIIRIIDEQNFKTDPLRILRAYRFAAVLDFDIEPRTKEILHQMVAAGMLKHLTAERVWKETRRALQKGANSAKFFAGLAEIGGLHGWFSELEKLVETPEIQKYHQSENTFKHIMCALTMVREDDDLIKWAVLNHDNGKGTTPLEILPHHNGHETRGLQLIEQISSRLKTPKEYCNFALLFCREHMRVGKFNNMRLSKQYDMVSSISDNFRNRKLLEMFLRCFYADYYGETKLNEYCNDADFQAICAAITEIYDIMEGITLKSLSETCQQNLARLKGKEFGQLYREYMLKYLQDKLKK